MEETLPLKVRVNIKLEKIDADTQEIIETLETEYTETEPKNADD